MNKEPKRRILLTPLVEHWSHSYCFHITSKADDGRTGEGGHSGVSWGGPHWYALVAVSELGHHRSSHTTTSNTKHCNRTPHRRFTIILVSFGEPSSPLTWTTEMQSMWDKNTQMCFSTTIKYLSTNLFGVPSKILNIGSKLKYWNQNTILQIYFQNKTKKFFEKPRSGIIEPKNPQRNGDRRRWKYKIQYIVSLRNAWLTNFIWLLRSIVVQKLRA